jgi:hypothetical protein
MALMKEPHHLMLRLIPCCYNQQLLRMRSEQTLNEGFWILIKDLDLSFSEHVFLPV